MCLSYPTRTVRNFTSANITSSVIRTSGQHFGTPFAIFGPFDNARALINAQLILARGNLPVSRLPGDLDKSAA